MKKEKFNMESLTRSKLKKVNGGIILWLLATVATACIGASVENPNDFMSGVNQSIAEHE